MNQLERQPKGAVASWIRCLNQLFFVVFLQRGRVQTPKRLIVSQSATQASVRVGPLGAALPGSSETHNNLGGGADYDRSDRTRQPVGANDGLNFGGKRRGFA